MLNTSILVVLKKILPIFSYIFHPIFISMYATLLYVYFKQDTFPIQEIYYILFHVGVSTVIVPILFFLLLRSTGNVNSVMIHETSQRIIPLVLQCFLFILLVKRSIVLSRYPELHFFLLGALFSTIAALIASLFKTKASLHMMSIGGFVIFVVGLNMHLQLHNPYWPAFLVLMTGIVASSRLVMKAHTNRELSIGLVMGIVPQILFLYLWL